MKNYILCLMILCIFQSTTSGKIKNGYSVNMHTVVKSLEALRELSGKRKLNVFQKLHLQKQIKEHLNYAFYFQQTENLLRQFHEIAPELYNEIDSIMDHRGRVIDVYVKLVPEDKIKLPVGGITNIDHVADDVDAYRSHYGDYSASIKIKMIPPALSILAHEFGHIRYQVPNLAHYVQYYNLHYRNRLTQLKLIGHNADDSSGESADAYVKRFKGYYKNYLRRKRGGAV